MGIHLSVETSCWRQCFRRTFERYSSLDGPSSGSFGFGNSPGRSARTLYHEDRKSTRLNSSHGSISYAVFCLKKKKKKKKKQKNQIKKKKTHHINNKEQFTHSIYNTL